MKDRPSHDEAVAEWLVRANDPRKTAAVLLKDHAGAPSVVCFLSHQTAELSLKALIEARGTKMPKTHILTDLVDIVSAYFPDAHELYNDAVLLDPYYLDTRYDTGMKLDEFTWPRAEAAFSATERIYDFAKRQVK